MRAAIIWLIELFSAEPLALHGVGYRAMPKTDKETWTCSCGQRQRFWKAARRCRRCGRSRS